MSNIMRFIKSTGIYLLGNGLIKIVLFLMLPIYTRYINPVDYGTYDVNVTYISFLASILFFDIWSAIMRFMFDYKNEERVKPILAGLTIFLFSSILYGIVTFSIGPIFIKQYLVLVFLYGLFMNLQNVLGYIARGYGKNLLYIVAGIVGTFVMIILNIIFLIVLRYNYSCLYISSIISYIINVLIIIVAIKGDLDISNMRIDKKLLKNMLFFALPLSLNSIAYWFLNSYNRVVINNQLGSFENGLYAVAVKFGAILNLVTQCFQLSLQEMTFEKAAEEGTGKSEYYSKVMNAYIKFLSTGALCILPFIKIIYPYMIDSEYISAINLVPLYIIAMLISAVSLYLGVIFSAIKESKHIFISTLLGSVCNVIAIHILLGVFGLQAANIALIIGIMVNVLFRLIVLKKNVKIKLDFFMVIKMFILVCVQVYIYMFGNWLVNSVSLILSVLIAFIYYKDTVISLVKNLIFRQ